MVKRVMETPLQHIFKYHNLSQHTELRLLNI
nr:MAG TPA: hypothetical protein [Caudoviricetes sp.]